MKPIILSIGMEAVEKLENIQLLILEVLDRQVR
jgi:hypothetical protein